MRWQFEHTRAVRTALILTLLAVIPSILICMTSFRIVVVLSMVRHAFGMPETPPNPVLVSLALFMTAFIMSPTLTAVNSAAIKPLLADKIGVEEAMTRGPLLFGISCSPRRAMPTLRRFIRSPMRHRRTGRSR